MDEREPVSQYQPGEPVTAAAIRGHLLRIVDMAVVNAPLRPIIAELETLAAHLARADEEVKRYIEATDPQGGLWR